jgi:phosphatidylserine/phosphatidylglycerophosphate/cardiolipin synthase-like enzyme
MARQLVALKKAGCDVKVLFDSWQTDDGVEAVLRAGHIPIYDTHVGDTNGMYMHAKTTTISARVNGTRRNYVFTGSPNFSWAARQLNSESMLRINSKAEVELHFRWWDSVLAATTTART